MDLTYEQWRVLEPLIGELPRPADGRGRPWRSSREVLNGILWILRTGAQWAELPDQYPPYQTCHRRFQRWVQDGMLSWSLVSHCLEQSHTYWLATTRPDGRPHVVPIWGLWLEDAFYFGGSPTTRWARNVATNPAVALHLEDAEQVIMVEGLVDEYLPDSDLTAQLSAASAAKYATGVDSSAPTEGAQESILRLRPQIILAWRNFPQDATRWRFTGC
jgi:transposase